MAGARRNHGDEDRKRRKIHCIFPFRSERDESQEIGAKRRPLEFSKASLSLLEIVHALFLDAPRREYLNTKK